MIRNNPIKLRSSSSSYRLRSYVRIPTLSSSSKKRQQQVVLSGHCSCSSSSLLSYRSISTSLLQQQQNRTAPGIVGKSSLLPRPFSSHYQQQNTAAFVTLSSEGGGSSSSSPFAASAATESTSSSSIVVPPPPLTREQYMTLFWNAAIPMIGFGFMDQTIMLQSGNAIDCSVGVLFGLSTLTAAGVGQIVSMTFGVFFGDTLERCIAKFRGPISPTAKLLPEQKLLPIVQRTKLTGSVVGVIIGCCLGLLNVLFIDTDRSESLKIRQQALANANSNDTTKFMFEIEVSNSDHPITTVLKVTGPDSDGLLATMTTALAVHGCSLIELHAGKRSNNSTNTSTSSNPTDSEPDMIEDIFYVVNRETGYKFRDDELSELGSKLLDSICGVPTVTTLSTMNTALQTSEGLNHQLRTRIQQLEELLHHKQITIVTTTGSNTSNNATSHLATSSSSSEVSEGSEQVSSTSADTATPPSPPNATADETTATPSLAVSAATTIITTTPNETP